MYKYANVNSFRSMKDIFLKTSPLPNRPVVLELLELISSAQGLLNPIGRAVALVLEMLLVDGYLVYLDAFNSWLCACS